MSVRAHSVSRSHDLDANETKTVRRVHEKTHPGRDKSESKQSRDCDEYSISALEIYPNLSQCLGLVLVSSTTSLLLKYPLRAFSHVYSSLSTLV